MKAMVLMMKKTAKRFSTVILMLIVLFVFGCEKKVDIASIIGTDKMKISNYSASFVIDETDLVQITTFSSYVFVAKVISYDRTEYLNDDPETPMTFYSVQVLENIKGKLRTEENIELKKAGGLIKGSDFFSLCMGDILPEPGKTYLFAAVIFDNDLYCPMPNMVVELDASDSNWAENRIVQQYSEACRNPDPNVSNGNQNKSKYDAGE